MESLKLTEPEQRVYAELFAVCDQENTGKVTGIKAYDLFLTSGLNQDVLHKEPQEKGPCDSAEAVSADPDLSGGRRSTPQLFQLGGFTLRSFHMMAPYGILKQGIKHPEQVSALTASAESHGRFSYGILDSLQASPHLGGTTIKLHVPAGPEFPLPAFGHMYPVDGRPPMDHSYNPHINDQGFGYPDRPIQGGVGGTGLPPPPKHPRGSLQTQRIPGYDSQSIQSNTQDSPADTLSPQFSPNGSPPISPGQQPADTHSMRSSGPSSGQFGYPDQYNGQPERSWARFDEDNQALLSGVQHEQKQWANFSDHNKADTSSISSEAESVDDVWSITEEQHEYYVNQFMTMQPDTTGIVPGHIAKEFFEKSKLPVQELSKIWQLSDVDRDGGLSLEEFCTAMHLVVLRRNDIELPEHLPPALMPYVPLGSTEEPFAADLPQGSTLRRATPPSPSPPPSPTQPSPEAQSSQWPPPTFVPQPPQSPTSSSLSSPGTKPEPVKFGFQPVMSDPDSKIVHPVPMRVSPDGNPLPIDGIDRSRAFSDGAVISRGYEPLSGGAPVEPVLSPTKPRTPADLVDVGPDHHHPGPPLAMPLQSRPRPTPKKAQSVPGPAHVADVPPQPPIQPVVRQAVRQPFIRPPPLGEGADRPTTLPGVPGEQAPPPPPRSRTGHSRSSSLDNQLIDFSDDHHHQSSGRDLKPPPAVPPRPSPKDATNTGTYTQGATAPPDIRDMGACAIPAVVDKDVIPAMGSSRNLLDSDEETRDDIDQTQQLAKEMRDKKELKATVRKHRGRNNMLLRLNNELNQELQEVMEQRIALEIQLEHLRPFST